MPGSTFLNRPMRQTDIVIPHGSIYESTQTANQIYFARLTIPVAFSVTGLRIDNGGTVAGNVLVALFNASGTQVASSGSIAMSGTYYFQDYPFTTPFFAPPGDYYPAMVPSSSTASWINCHNASLSNNAARGSFTLPASITLPSFAVGYTPIMATY